MSLALVGPQRLDELQRLVERSFSSVPGRVLPPASEAYDALPPPFRPRDDPSGPSVTIMAPVNDGRSLKLSWCVPVPPGQLASWIRTKPEEVWSLLLGNRGKGSLSTYLKRKGLANGLDAGAEEFTRSFILLTISIDLTEAGLKRWRAVCATLFTYLRLLAASGAPSHLVEETIAMAATSFAYAEPNEPQDFASTAATNLPYFERMRTNGSNGSKLPR